MRQLTRRRLVINPNMVSLTIKMCIFVTNIRAVTEFAVNIFGV